MKKSTSTAIGTAIGIVIVAAAGLALQAWLLGVILSWFSVFLTFWQNVVIILLANMILKGGTSK